MESSGQFSLSARKKPRLGPPAVRDLKASSQPLLVKRSPVFCLTVLSGYRRKADLERLIRLVDWWCGGSVQRDVATNMTRLEAANSMGEKYATTFSIPVINEHWLDAAWDRREEVGHRADDKEVMDGFTLQLFAENVVFYGFELGELQHMNEVLLSNLSELTKLLASFYVVEKVSGVGESTHGPAGVRVIQGTVTVVLEDRKAVPYVLVEGFGEIWYGRLCLCTGAQQKVTAT